MRNGRVGCRARVQKVSESQRMGRFLAVARCSYSASVTSDDASSIMWDTAVLSVSLHSVSAPRVRVSSRPFDFED